MQTWTHTTHPRLPLPCASAHLCTVGTWTAALFKAVPGQTFFRFLHVHTQIITLWSYGSLLARSTSHGRLMSELHANAE